MSFPSRARLRAVVVAAAFGAPVAVAACSLTPFASPGDTTTSGGGATSTGTTSTGGASTGGTTSTGGATSTGGSTTGGGGTASTGGTTSTGGGTTSSSSGGTTGGGGSTGGAGGVTTGSGGAVGGTGGSTTSSTGTGGMDLDAGADAADAPNEASVCGAVEALFPLEAGIHVASCTPLTYATNPPTSGTHYPTWAAFKTYDKPVPRGFYVHSMEHGAVVFEHNCAGNCDADVAALVAYLAARPANPACVAPLTNRFIVTPDPLLDVPFAVSAWGASLKMQCLDFAAIGAFIDAHYAKAPENFCFDGVDVTDPASGFPADCGAPSDAGSD